MSGVGGYVPNVGQIHQALAKAEARSDSLLARAAVLSAKSDATEQFSEAFNPFSADKKVEQQRKDIKEHQLLRREDLPQSERVIGKEAAQNTANEFFGRNPDLPADHLMDMRTFIAAKGGSAEEILEEVMRRFPDPSLADEALDFLIQTTTGDLRRTIEDAKTLLLSRLAREVTAGHNIKEEAIEFEQMGLGTATELRDLYRDITGNPREQNALFHELADQYGYEELKDVIKFLLRSLGRDLKAEGPSIARGKLYRLTTEVRVLQSILGVYRFFLGRENLLNAFAAQYELKRPESLHFEAMAREFMRLVEDRYPNAAKVLRLAQELGIEEDLLMQIIVFQQLRDATRGIAPRIYKTLKQRWELYAAIIEALEELEAELEAEDVDS